MTPADRAAAAAARPSGAQSCRAAGASVSPAGRRRHSGARRSPLPIVPRTPTAFPAVVGRGGCEPPARPSPPSAAPVAGDAGVASQRSKLGRCGSPGGSRGAQASGSISPARSPGAGQPPWRRAPPRPHPSALVSCPPADSGGCAAAQARGKLRGVCGPAGELCFPRGGGDADRPGRAEGPRVDGCPGSPGGLSRVASALPCLCPSVRRGFAGGCVSARGKPSATPGKGLVGSRRAVSGPSLVVEAGSGLSKRRPGGGPTSEEFSPTLRCSSQGSWQDTGSPSPPRWTQIC